MDHFIWERSDVITGGMRRAVLQKGYTKGILLTHHSFTDAKDIVKREDDSGSSKQGKLLVQDVRRILHAIIMEGPFRGNNARGNGVAGNVGGQTEEAVLILWGGGSSGKTHKCYNSNSLGHIARDVQGQSDFKIQILQGQDAF
ncbi:hypothetical protein Tco_0907263 [Tanacetum coccineum]|uniref:Uncharacterized protein n=1 Tax=Tanacetum coccineum TaxID=301880 RepID=A0ABQ5CL12_9ASTR